MKYIKLLMLLLIVIGPDATRADDTTVAKDAPKTSYPHVLRVSRNPHKGTTYKFVTQNTGMNWRAIASLKTPLPVLEVASNKTLSLYNWTSIGGFVPTYPVAKTIPPAHRSLFYHNGVFEKHNGVFYYQMIEKKASGREVIAGWASGNDLVSPATPGFQSYTEANFKNCTNCGPVNSQSLESIARLTRSTQGLQPMNEPLKPTYQYACPIDPQYAVRVTSKFKIRKHPITGQVRQHKGMDFGRDLVRGLPSVMNIARGTVLRSGLAGSFGMQVVVRTIEGLIITYNHLAKNCSLPGIGADLKKGQKLGCMGNTGMSEAPHLHLEVYASEEHYKRKEAMSPQSLINFYKACDDVAVLPGA